MFGAGRDPSQPFFVLIGPTLTAVVDLAPATLAGSEWPAAVVAGVWMRLVAVMERSAAAFVATQVLPRLQ